MTGGENRRRSILKALRKKKLDQKLYRWANRSYYDNLHQYSKNKIHCSCPMCSTKTRNKGHSKLKGMIPGINYKISDIKKIQKLEYQDD